MTRTVRVQIHVSIPEADKRAAETVAESVVGALERSRSASLAGLAFALVDYQVTVIEDDIYTVHPFDDEWTWDPEKSGAHPWATSSLQEAIDHANLVRLEYASVPDVDADWIAGFWSSIYVDGPEQSARADSMIGFVDPSGNYHEGDEPPLDDDGHWVGWADE